MSAVSLIVLGCLIAALVGFLGILSALETACISLESRGIGGAPARDTGLPPMAGRRLSSPGSPVIHVVFVSTVLRLATAILSVAFLHGLCGHFGAPFAPPAVAWFSAVIVLGDVLPKLIARAHPAGVFRRTARRVFLLTAPLLPLSLWLSRIMARQVELLTRRRLARRARLEKDELGVLVDLQAEEGALEEVESGMIKEILKLREKTAKDLMAPRVDIEAVAEDTNPEEVVRLLCETRRSYLPVYRGSLDSLAGFLDVRASLESQGGEITRFLRRPLMVSETMKALDLFSEHLGRPGAPALVIDEFGGLEGLVTHTDIVEEIT